MPPVRSLALREPRLFSTPKRTSCPPPTKPVREKVPETESLSPTARLTGEPELVKKPQKPSALVPVVVMSKVAEPTASFRTVAVRPLKILTEFGRDWLLLNPSANESLRSVLPAAPATKGMASATTPSSAAQRRRVLKAFMINVLIRRV